jgi:hypothetical protein
MMQPALLPPFLMAMMMTRVAAARLVLGSQRVQMMEGGVRGQEHVHLPSTSLMWACAA